jgi:class 3 adenylate cyclase
VREGQLADQMLVVVEGRARVSRFGETIGYAEAGACVGGRELYERRPNVLTMTAETSMVLRAATARDLLSLLSVIPRAEFVRPPIVRPAEAVDVRVEPFMAPRPIEARCHATELVAVGAPTSPEAPPDGSTAPQAIDENFDEVEELIRFRPTDENNRELAALLFTDIVGSTMHLSSVGDHAWHELLDAHDAILARQVQRYDGAIVNFLGDGALARFPCAYSAVRCALAIRQEVRNLGVDMRAGLHVGEVEVRGTDISGIAVHVASRICDAAGSGRVLASSTLAGLVAGSGLVFEDAGTHHLKDVAGEWNLVAVNE